ncbi:MAG: 30S ribosomal protein S15 [Planctomycetota bacterium]
MSITAEKKQEVINAFGRDDKDTGSPEVQVAILTHRIKEMTAHLKQHKHDYSSQRGLLAMVSKRTRLLRYLKKNNRQSYLDLIAKLGLRK